ncbi:hypothetical protein BDP27DRAFT_1547589 [Rhodocollybia butyracea]|uniref:Uncharacterized protein n=1 Tax=Rhodocollybia butyracea TaxID=206335 RepID=A0A9P5PMQ5_9AGAR|nr:hypothetical protein BDP27DRAFT_1547589 [Rhodocollybia butyracea]
MASFFDNSSHFSVHDSQFLNANQITYRTIPGGDLDLLQDLGSFAEVEEVVRGGTHPYMTRYRTSPRGVSLTYDWREAAVFYDGPSAEQAYKDDLLRYSALRHINIAKLFGITHCGSPALIFQSDMIPYVNFYEQCHSPIARIYLTYQFKQTFGLQQAMDYLQSKCSGFLDSFLGQDTLESEDITLDMYAWIQPTSRHICFGPPTASSPAAVPLGVFGTVGPESSLATSVPLELMCYKSEKKHTYQIQPVAQIQLKQRIRVSGWLRNAWDSIPAVRTPLVVTSHGRARCSATEFDGALCCDITSSTYDPNYLAAA